jgi:uncharacterized protein with HEPN domain
MFSERARRRLQDVVENADWIDEYLAGFDLDRFLTDRKTTDAVERCLERIAEAIVQLGVSDAETAGITLPWHDVRSLGNRLRHEYRRINRKIIYDTARDDIPALRDAAFKALNE